MDLFSPLHIIILLVIALLVFGPKRLPEIGSGLGKSIREFKQSMNGMMTSEPKETPREPGQEYPAQVVVTDENTPK
ncbi:twin-arginine translocase TatA/TatE family subunit [Sulfobacillus harzensis]|uniref:twin-arginine translocase TatA/TatE family subunit n=1 Tax=Sulfobacillus harzensis TaxID=2729629 RepID=UPI0030845735